jgi:hypothetical protein
MYWVLAVIGIAALVVLWRARSGSQTWRRGATFHDGTYRCPLCELEVSGNNPMVLNFSGHRAGLSSQRRWCQVCERNAEQHVIHRA